MAKDDQQTLTPKLRFPEFREMVPWQVRPLKQLLTRSPEYGINAAAVPFSESLPTYLRITDIDDDGRFIAEKKVSVDADVDDDNYLNDGDVVLARTGASVGKSYRYRDCDGRLVFAGFLIRIRPNPEKLISSLLASYLTTRSYGDWVRMTSARSGQPGINGSEYASLPVPLPVSASDEYGLAEQKKIAECLTSLDELIAAQGQKVEALKAHKCGLMQHVFPRTGETLPCLRFPEFQDAPEWQVDPLGELFETMTGGTPDRAVKEYWSGSIPWITTSLVDFNVINNAEEFISEVGLEKSSAKLFPKNTVLVALYGQGKTRGKVALLGIESATNQACAAILPNDDIEPAFTFLSLCGRYDEMRALSNSGGQENLSQGLIRELPFSYPKEIGEQRRIVACLSTLDAQVTAEAHKLAMLKTHKQGLMQQLFPSLEDA